MADSKSSVARSPEELRVRSSIVSDAISGFLVFLIALPLCLGISMASGFPPFAGVLTAVIGGLVVSPLMGAPLTIKGPAAGLIVIAVGSIEELGRGDPAHGYRLALAVVVVSGVIQIAFGLLRAGKVGDFFPAAAVHGMLAAIGIIIAAKQLHVVLGVTPVSKGSLALIAEIPRSVAHAERHVAIIGLVSLALLFGWPLLGGRWAKRVPAPLVVLLVSMPMAYAMNVGPGYLVKVPDSFASIIAFPDFSQIASFVALKYVVLYAMIGSVESLLSAKAVDTLDPWRRTSDLDRDLVATGIGNTLAGLLGGLPMISEIVRSSANVQNGGRTRWANFVHGACLLGLVALAPQLVHRIPLAALAAMLVYTGFRLASPAEFKKTLAVGFEQLAVFVTTIVTTLATDLLVGIAAGVLLKLVLHMARGVPPGALFKAILHLHEEDGLVLVRVSNAAVFSNYLGLKARLALIPADRRVVLDLANTKLVDHTVMGHLEREAALRSQAGGSFEVRGLERHRPASAHPHAARLRSGA